MSEVVTIALPWGHREEELQAAIEIRLGAGAPYRVLKRSLDARNHRAITVLYSIEPEGLDPCETILENIALRKCRLASLFGATPPRVVIVGAGPAGLFCAWWLVLHGLRPILLEQGPPMRERIRDMARFMKTGDLHPLSNICFGAGGAGAWSDGKLITRIRSPYIPFVMKTFVDLGGPEDIRYLYNPHLGSNRIRRCISTMLDRLEEEGVSLRTNTQWTGLGAAEEGRIGTVCTSEGPIENVSALFVATGHSSRLSFSLLREAGVDMEAKDFAVGLRVEHPADTINRLMYGEEYRERYPGIETAQYKFARTWKEPYQGVYSFCMCPGGYILNASTGPEGVVTNGMSNALKSGRFSNAAVVATVTREDLAKLGYHGVDASLAFQQDLEERFRASVNRPGQASVLPGQRLADFVQGRPSSSLGPGSCLNPTLPASLHQLFPPHLYEGLRRGLTSLGGSLRRFCESPEAQAFGVESRTSSPYRLPRDPVTLQSPSRPHLYPMGEGAGHAGGITSAAVDGIRCAQAWMEGSEE